MAGHSKWANIQHRKKKQDAKRGKAFTKLIREIVVAARMGGEQLDANPRLRAAVDAALGQNMKRDVIDRAVKRGAGGLEGGNLLEVSYEGYGPSGVAVLVLCMTDNKNRTVAEVRHAFSKAGGNLGTDGSVAYLFEQCGMIVFDPVNDGEELFELALESGVEDITETDDGGYEIKTGVADFMRVKSALIAAEYVPSHAELTRLATTTAPVTTIKEAEQLQALVDRLEDLDDVQSVYHNAEFSEQVLEQIEGDT